MKEMIVALLNQMSKLSDNTKVLEQTARIMNLSRFEMLSEKSLFRKRAPRKNFIDQLLPQEEQPELSVEEVLRLNRISQRYSSREIEEFLEAHMDLDGNVPIGPDTVRNDEDFEKLILAYDSAGKKNSRFLAHGGEGEIIDNGAYVYPKLTFIRR